MSGSSLDSNRDQPSSKRRPYDYVLSSDYLDGLGDRSLDDLRSMREVCRVVEGEVSLERRLCHARIDILAAELDRRQGDNDVDAERDLSEFSYPGAAPTEKHLPGRSAEYSAAQDDPPSRRSIDEIVDERILNRLNRLGEEEIREIMSKLADHEREYSGRRRRVHEVLDRIQAELVKRYTTGRQDQGSLPG
jgi:hypothetical protein